MATAADRDAAQQLFSTYATGFRPDDAAINFWADKIANQGFDSAFNEFINPSDTGAPRTAAMFSDPDYLSATGQQVAAIDPRAQAMFDLYATGFTPDPTALQFWSQKIADEGYASALNQFLNPTDTASPRYEAMQADPQFQGLQGTDEDFQRSVGLLGEENRAELDAELRNWYNTYTGGQGMNTPVDFYVSMLNGRDGTYLSQDYAAAKQKMLADAQDAGLYGGERPSMIRYDNWLRTQQANNASTGTMGGATGGATTGGAATGGAATGGGTFNNNMRVSTQIDGTATSPSGTALDLFSIYATGFTPDQTALDFWNNKIATLGFEGARREFINPTDRYAPRNQIMFSDPDYIAAGGTMTWMPRETIGGGAAGGDQMGGEYVPPLTQEGMATYGGYNFMATPLSPGFYSERGMERGFVPFGQGMLDANAMFGQYATNFTPDQTALDFWNNKIATLGYQGALNEFLNPSDMNAPRNQTMFADPDYAFAQSQLAAGFAPPTVMPQATFRSGVAGYTPMTPTGFQFGVAPVTAPRYSFTAGQFDPGVIGADGTWVPTASWNAQQEQSIQQAADRPFNEPD